VGVDFGAGAVAGDASPPGMGPGVSPSPQAARPARSTETANTANPRRRTFTAATLAPVRRHEKFVAEQTAAGEPARVEEQQRDGRRLTGGPRGVESLGDRAARRRGARPRRARGGRTRGSPVPRRRRRSAPWSPAPAGRGGAGHRTVGRRRAGASRAHRGARPAGWALLSPRKRRRRRAGATASPLEASTVKRGRTCIGVAGLGGSAFVGVCGARFRFGGAVSESHEEDAPVRLPYVAPSLVVLGTVQDLTRGGDAGPSDGIGGEEIGGS
jgi:hypothetical protein